MWVCSANKQNVHVKSKVPKYNYLEIMITNVSDVVTTTAFRELCCLARQAQISYS